MFNERIIKSVKAATKLNADKMFRSILADKSFQDFILFLNKKQLFEGEDSLGVKLSSIGGGYSFTTEFLNTGRTFDFARFTAKKVAGGSPILYDTGEYYDSFTIEVDNNGFVISSNPQKETGNLEDVYGNNLEGLQDENLQKIINVIRDKFQAEVRKLLLVN
jgi:hypothetical protein